MSDKRKMVDAVIAEMWRRPQDFTAGEFTLKDSATGYSYWISNGLPYYGVYQPYKFSFGWYHGWRFSRDLQRFKVLKAKEKFSTVT